MFVRPGHLDSALPGVAGIVLWAGFGLRDRRVVDLVTGRQHRHRWVNRSAARRAPTLQQLRVDLDRLVDPGQ
jgi:hypothetical protein